MSDLSKPWRLLRRIVPQRAERAPDPGDMGTAFGLDYCLSQHEPAAEPAPATDSDLPESSSGIFRRMYGVVAPR